jgi:DNA-directed RNA polymerase subunit RPC12/RpoP
MREEPLVMDGTLYECIDCKTFFIKAPNIKEMPECESCGSQNAIFIKFLD